MCSKRFLRQSLDIFTGHMMPLNNQDPSLTSINQPIEPRIKPRLPTVAHTTEGLEKIKSALISSQAR